ncbi:MAG: acyl-CoA thioesterase domain-containing protein [Ilumatobacteraceae bacterium]
MSQAFGDATAVERVAAGRYRGTIHDGWDIGGNANGGYVLAIAVRAMAEEAGRPPLTITAHYLSPAARTVRARRRDGAPRASARHVHGRARAG